MSAGSLVDAERPEDVPTQSVGTIRTGPGTVPRPLRSMGVWEYESMGVWEYGSMGVWESKHLYTHTWIPPYFLPWEGSLRHACNLIQRGRVSETVTNMLA